MNGKLLTQCWAVGSGVAGFYFLSTEKHKLEGTGFLLSGFCMTLYNTMPYIELPEAQMALKALLVSGSGALGYAYGGSTLAAVSMAASALLGEYLTQKSTPPDNRPGMQLGT